MIIKAFVILFAIHLVFISPLFAQEKEPTRRQVQNTKDSLDIDTERAFDFFAAAGASYRFGDLYNVTISQIDYTVQFEDVSPIMTRFSLGLVWNPIPDLSNKSYQEIIKNKTKPYYEAARNFFSVALLINIFQLGFTSSDFNISSPVDVGFGVGYRSSNFLALGTVEFTPIRTPREYFVTDYLDKDRTLIYDGSSEPARTISIDDNTIFTDKVFICVGLKVAYAFGKKKNEAPNNPKISPKNE